MPAPSPAATVIPLREGLDSFELLMVRRNSRGFFGGLMVFPGGRVDPIDAADGDVWSEESHRRAAVRELAEEAGVLTSREGLLPFEGGKGPAFYNAVNEAGLKGDTESLTLVSRWVTPEKAPRRFDTRFYLLAGGDWPEVRVDRDELVDHQWITPAEALQRRAAGEFEMWLPTVAHIRWLSRRSSPGDAVASARGADGRTLIRPERAQDGSIVPVHLPAEPA